MIRYLAFVLLALPAHAQALRDCDTWEASARNVVWADPTRTFANGDIRLVALDTAEPACCSFHVMVLWLEPEGFQSCALVSAEPGGLGFSDVTLSAAGASYDPARGLTVRVPVASFDGAQARAALVDITVNRATGQVGAR